MVEPAPPDSWKPRLSVASFLLLITCLGMLFGFGVQLWRTRQQVQLHAMRASRLSEENRRLREEYGEFEVEDPGLFYAAQMNRDELNPPQLLDWKWRVYAPRAYSLNFAEGAIGKAGAPMPAASLPIERGMHTIRLRYQPEMYDAREDWRIEIETNSVTNDARSNHTHALHATDAAWPPPRYTPEEKWPWAVPIEGVNWGTMTVRPDHSQQPNQRIVLQRVLVAPSTIDLKTDALNRWERSLDAKSKESGFLLWLEPVK